MNALRAYMDTQKQTASPERLMVMLFEAALRHTRAGAAALEGGRNVPALGALGKASEIVSYLMATLDPGRDQTLSDGLADVYTFVLARLVRASSAYDAAAAREAERVFAPVAAAFAQAVDAVERGQARPAR